MSEVADYSSGVNSNSAATVDTRQVLPGLFLLQTFQRKFYMITGLIVTERDCFNGAHHVGRFQMESNWSRCRHWLNFGLLLKFQAVFPKALCCLFQTNKSCTLNSASSRRGVGFMPICWEIFLKASSWWSKCLGSWDESVEATWAAVIRGCPRLIHDHGQQKLAKGCPGAKSGQIPVCVKFY